MSLPVAPVLLAGTNPILHLSLVDYFIVGIYFITVLAIGFYLKRQASTG